MRTTSGCLGDDTVAALLEGGLAPAAARDAREHLAGCDACRQLLSDAIDAEVPPSASAVARRHSHLEPGSMVAGRYRIERQLGEGGMGRVFVARQIGLERPVAIKVLLPELANDHQALARFYREARLVASLASEHVVRVHDLGELPGGEPFLVMELLDGEDLGAIAARGPIAADVAVRWIADACEALGEAHALGIVHRDVKPGNLFLTRYGKVKVLDFGLAKLAGGGAGMTSAGMMLGSPRYMAPEQVGGAHAVDSRADIWALGATLYHLVTGAPPFPETTLDGVLASILAGNVPSLAHLPPHLGAAIARCMTLDPAARFQTTSQLSAALRPAKSFERRALIAAIVTVAVAGVAGVALVTWRPWQTSATAPAGVPTNRGQRALSDLDEANLRARLEKNGWSLLAANHDQFDTCPHVQLIAQKLDAGHNAWGELYLMDCESGERAQLEATRFHAVAPARVVAVDGKRMFSALAGQMGSAAYWEEKSSQALFDAMLAP